MTNKEKFNKLITDSCDFISDMNLYEDIIKDLEDIYKYKKIEEHLGTNLIDLFKAIENLNSNSKFFPNIYFSYKGKKYIIKENTND